MKMTHIQTIYLQASEGCLLTNGEVFTDSVYIGTADSPDNWYEVTAEQADEMQRQKSSNPR